MAILIGAGTTITSAQFPNGGIASIQFGFQPDIQRLFQLGSFSPYDTFIRRTRTLQVSVYGSRPDGAGGSIPYSVAPSVTCVDANSVTATVNPATCVAGLDPFTNEYWVTSYSYQKEQTGYGQESWSMTTAPILDNFTGTIVMMRGIPDGTIATGPGTMASADMGLVVDETGSNDALGNPVQGENGSVQAGGFGTFDVQRSVIVTSVGDSIGLSPAIDGLTGQASINIPMTPQFI